MRGTMWLTALGCGILLSSSGCSGFLRDGGCGRGYGYESCGPRDDCGPTCGSVRRPSRQHIHGDACGECGTCGSCSENGDECGSCCQRNFCFRPLRAIGRLFSWGTWCGPSYCESPDSCESCNRGGQQTGRSGCSSCNRGGIQESGDMSPVQDDPVMEPTPAAKAPTKATRRVPASSYDR